MVQGKKYRNLPKQISISSAASYDMNGDVTKGYGICNAPAHFVRARVGIVVSEGIAAL